jgi:hypothetical protein
MAQISIIEVNLGINIGDLINEDVVGLVGEAQQELETAIAVAKQVVALKEQKQREVQDSIDKTHGVMLKAYEMLVQAGNKGVLVTDILAVTSDVIPQAFAFALRMKKILKEEGNKYALVRKQISGQPYYLFLRYNITEEETQ